MISRIITILGVKTPEGGKEFPEVAELLSKGIAAEEIFTQVSDGIVQRFARIAGLETEFASGFRTV